ncbi:hypothetical protein J6590_039040 [Homalodisca vitripennis]|nr:hypothetical protein J6590_039040 [Homalodisca vitripennis]
MLVLQSYDRVVESKPSFVLFVEPRKGRDKCNINRTNSYTDHGLSGAQAFKRFYNFDVFCKVNISLNFGIVGIKRNFNGLPCGEETPLREYRWRRRVIVQVALNRRLPKLAGTGRLAAYLRTFNIFDLYNSHPKSLILLNQNEDGLDHTPLCRSIAVPMLVPGAMRMREIMKMTSGQSQQVRVAGLRTRSIRAAGDGACVDSAPAPGRVPSARRTAAGQS